VPIMASSLPIPPQGMVYAQQVHQVQQQGAPYMPGNQGQPMMAAGGQYYGSSGDIQSQAMGQGMAATPIYFAYPATTQAQFAYSTQMAGSYHQAQMQGQQPTMYAYSPHTGNSMPMMASSPQSSTSPMSYGTYGTYMQDFGQALVRPEVDEQRLMMSSGNYMMSPYGNQGVQVAPYNMHTGQPGGPVMVQAPTEYYEQQQQSYTHSYDPRQHGGMEVMNGGVRGGGRKGSAYRFHKSPDRRSSASGNRQKPLPSPSVITQAGPAEGRGIIPKVSSSESLKSLKSSDGESQSIPKVTSNESLKSLKSSDGEIHSHTSSNETSFQAVDGEADDTPFFVAEPDV
jgi:hypothetical protein